MALSLPTPGKHSDAELLFDLPEALMHHYMISLPFTCVNVYVTCSNMSTFTNLPPPSKTKGKKTDDSLKLPSCGKISPTVSFERAKSSKNSAKLSPFYLGNRL